MLFFTSTGRTYRLKAYEVPEAGSRNSLWYCHGQRIATRCRRIRYDYDRPERIHENVNLFIVTEFGVVKRTAIEEYRNIRRSGLNAINLDDGDPLDFRQS